MRDHIAVRVTRETARGLDLDAPEDERNAIGERMRVDADTDAKLGHPSASWRRARPSKIVTVS